MLNINIRRFAWLAGFSLLSSTIALASLPKYKVIDLGVLDGGDMSRGAGINNRGQIVGYGASLQPDDSIAMRGILWRRGTMTEIPTLLDPDQYWGQCFPARINNRGMVVGFATNYTGEDQAFLYDGTMHDLSLLLPPNYIRSSAADVNEKGDILIGAMSSDYENNQSFVYSHGSLRRIGSIGGSSTSAAAINNIGLVVGQATTAVGDYHAFLSTGRRSIDLGTLPGHTLSGASDINDFGVVTGFSQRYGPDDEGNIVMKECHAFVYWLGYMVDIGTLDGKPTFPNAINNRCEVVGEVLDDAFLYTQGQLVNLNDLVIDAPADTHLVAASQINDSGEIVGTARLGTEYHAFLAIPIKGGHR
jgi:probable HAF family extracellular repeat protein